MSMDQFENLYISLFEAILKGGFEPIAQVAYDYFKRPIVLIDADSKMIVQIPHQLTGDFIWDTMLQEEAVPPYIVWTFNQDQHMLSNLNKEHAFFGDWGFLEKQPRILSAVRIDGIIMGYMAVLCHNGTFSNDDLSAADIVSQAFMTVFRHMKSSTANLMHLESVFLADLFQGRISDKEVLEDWEKQLNIDISPGYCVACARPLTIFGESALLPYISKRIEKHEGFYHIVLGRTIFFLFKGLPSSVPDKQFAQNMQDRLEGFIGREYFSVGFSNRFDDLLHLGTFQYQAVQALNLGEAECAERKIFAYQDYTLKDIFSKIRNNMAPENYMHPALHTLMEYDKLHKTEYYATLRAYILSICTTGETTQVLNIHRNTLLYRLERIQEITHINLRDHDICTHLLCSFYLTLMNNSSVKAISS